ncbi:MAG: RDD family protein [Acidimicrobiales bacterium]
MSQTGTESQQWWYVQGETTMGPAGSAEIRSLVERGAMGPTSRVIPVGASEWSTIGDQRPALGLPDGPVPPPPPPAGLQPQWGPPGTAQPLGAPLASSGKRFGAYLLDGLLALVTLFIGWIIWSVITWGKGQTPAKSLLGMRVVRTDTGRAASRGTMALRELVYKGILGWITFSITTIVSAFMILSPPYQGIWDKIASTVVVEDPEGRLVT